MSTDGKTVAEILEAAANGRIGHKAAIKALHLETYNDLVETMRLNGLALWAHQPGRPEKGTMSVLATACGRTAASKRRADRS